MVLANLGSFQEYYYISHEGSHSYLHIYYGQKEL